MPSYVFRLPASLGSQPVTVYSLVGGVRGSVAATGTTATDGTFTATLAAGDYLAVVQYRGTETGVREGLAESSSADNVVRLDDLNDSTSDASAALRAAFVAPNPSALVANLTTPFYLAHRMGSGQAAEESLTAARIAVAQGAQVLDFDMRLLADGTLGLMHDNTINRTTTGSGNVADQSLASWLKLTMNHAGLVGGTGWPAEPPLTVEQVLREFGNKVILSPEPYDPGAYAIFDKMVTALGIDRRTILLQPSVTADQAPAIAAGYPCLNVTSAEPTTQSCAALKAAGWWGVAPAIAVCTQAAVTAAHAAGIKIVPYSMTGRFDRDKMLALGCDGVFTDYPGYVPGTNQTRTTDNFTSQSRTVGTIPLDGAGSMSWVAPNILQLTNLRVLLGYLAPPDPTNYTLTLNARLIADGGLTSSAFYTFANQSDYFSTDARTTQNGVLLDASNGYRFAALANPGAQLSLFGIKLTGNATPTNILTNGPGNYALNTWATYKMTVTPTQLKWEQVGVAGSVFLNHSEYRGLPYIGLGASSTATAQFQIVSVA